MLAEFARDLPHLTLGGGQQRAIVGCLLHFVRGPRLCESRLQIFECVRADRTSLTPEHDESNRTIELRNLQLRQCPSDLLGQTKTRHTDALALALFDIVIDIDFPVSNHDLIRELGQALSYVTRDEPVSIHVQPCDFERVERIDVLQLFFVERRQLSKSKTLCFASRALVGVAYLVDCVPILFHRKVSRFSARQRFCQ